VTRIRFNFGPSDQESQLRTDNCCDCFPFVPVNPTEEKWPKLCDYFDLGDLAPDFLLEGVYQGELVKISLSQYLGKWVALFFYSSDFTFV
jgi:hypothetical protein